MVMGGEGRGVRSVVSSGDSADASVRVARPYRAGQEEGAGEGGLIMAGLIIDNATDQ